MGKCTDDYIFGLYAGGLSVLKENDSRFNGDCSLRVYEWDGNLLYNYPFGDNIRMFTVDENQRFLYVVTDSDSIIRYDLKNVYVSENHKSQEE